VTNNLLIFDDFTADGLLAARKKQLEVLWRLAVTVGTAVVA
jgi:hypothetical protein